MCDGETRRGRREIASALKVKNYRHEYFIKAHARLSYLLKSGLEV
jgi:hypothetical protein